MKKIVCSFVMAGILFAAALAGAAEKARIVQITLKASHFNAGAIGRATFVPAGKSCEVVFDVANLQSWLQRPLRIYAFVYAGSCAKLGNNPAYEMNDTVTADRTGKNAWRVTRKIPVPLDGLLAGQYAVVVRSSPSDGNKDLFCGDIR